MGDTLMYNANDDKLNYPLCRIQYENNKTKRNKSIDVLLS